MKKLAGVIMVLACFSAQAQKWGNEIGLSYVYAKPVGNMGEIIDRGHGVSIYYGWVNPDRRLAIGFDMTLAQYGRDKSKQEFTLEDGTVAPMEIVVSNSFLNIMAYSRWYLTPEKPIRPYVIGKVGYSMFDTNLNVYDPDEFDHCEPLDSDVLYNDGTFIAVAGIGAKADLASLIKKLQTGRLYFEGSVSYTQGGQVRYMNADASQSQTHHRSTTPDGEHVMTEFINTQTQIVHEHHVGYLYQSPAQMTEFRLGFSFMISR